MNTKTYAPTRTNVLNVPSPEPLTTATIVGRVLALALAALAVLAGVAFAAATSVTVATTLAMLAVATVLVGAIALPLLFVHALGESF